MEDRDPAVALQACIAALRRGGVGEGGPPSSAEVERCLRRVGEALNEKEREIEWLREALEQSRESYEERSRAFEQLMGVANAQGGCEIPGNGISGVSNISGTELEQQHHGTTESACRNVGVCVSEEQEREQQWTSDGDGANTVQETASAEQQQQTLTHTQPDTAQQTSCEAASDGAVSRETGTAGEVSATDQTVALEQSEGDGQILAANGGAGSVGEESVGVAVTEGGVATAEGSGAGGVATGAWEETEGYQKVEFAALYYHAETGYYFDATTQQFFAPVSSTDHQSTEHSHPQSGQLDPQTGHSNTESSDKSTYESGPSGPTPKQLTSVTELLAAVSENASHKCGLSYDATSGMYYDHRYAMYYDQATQLYYDPEGGTYYEYDAETCQYQVHSRVKLPKKTTKPEDGLEKVTDLCSSSESEGDGELEEGEWRGPSYPEGSPPPEEEWAPCLRLVVGSSECVSRGTVFVVTQEGAQLGREPSGPNPISLSEVQVSKAHTNIRFSQRNGCFIITDLASQNGTFINNQRISEPKTQSKPHPLNHNDILVIGSTSFTLHIHAGWDTCEFCRWEEVRGGGGDGRSSEGEKLSWKRELNRIKKRYGLRMKDTYGEDPVRAPEGYIDRAAGRRQMVGSDMPDLDYPDAPPASVHRAISEESVGHKMLKKLGWRKGEGLGKGSKGRTEPIKAEVREVRSGLGSTGGGGKRSLDGVGSESAAKHARLVKHYSDVVARELEKRQ